MAQKIFEKDQDITSVEQVYELAQQRKAIYVVMIRRLQPASWLISMQARQLVLWIRRGMYTLKPKNHDNTGEDK